MPEQHYFLITTLPYEGSGIDEYSTEEQAQRRYEECKQELENGWILGLEIIQGIIIRKDGEVF